MKSFRAYLQEGIARKDHAAQPLHTLNTVNNRTLVFSGHEMVGHIDFHKGTPEIIPNSVDQYVAYINAAYRDSRLKIRRPVSRSIGQYSSLPAALAAVQNSLAALKR